MLPLLLAVNAVLAAGAVRIGTLTQMGGAAAFLVGAGVAIGLGWPGYVALLAYFILGSAATRIGWRRKAARGVAERRGGARGVRQALANGGPPLAFAIAAGFLGERDPAFAAAAAGFTGALATAAADTVASEIGMALDGRVVRLTDLSRVPPGTPGGVSVAGSLAGAAAAALVAGVAVAGSVVTASIAVVAASCGFAAAMLEGLLAPLEQRGWLDNDGVNAVSVLAGGVLTATLAYGAGA